MASANNPLNSSFWVISVEIIKVSNTKRKGKT